MFESNKRINNVIRLRMATYVFLRRFLKKILHRYNVLSRRKLSLVNYSRSQGT